MKLTGAMGCFIKAIIALIIILGIALLVLQCGGNSCIRKIDKTLPDISKVPWEVTTPSHLYYADDVLETDISVTMSGWYEQLDAKWVKQKGAITLDRKIYGRITVRRR